MPAARPAPAARPRQYLVIDLKSFYASVECVERGLDPMTTDLVVADLSRTKKTICLAVSPSLKGKGVRNRCRLFEIPDGLLRHTVVAVPRMRAYIERSADIYGVYLRYVAADDIHVYSIDEAFMDVTGYLDLYGCDARELGERIRQDVVASTGVPATCGLGPNLYLAKVALDITAKHSPGFFGELDEDRYKETLWCHRPITDFWRVGAGTARRLAELGIHTMGQLALYPQDPLFRVFGVDAEILIDHAWGREPVTIADIKAYRPRSHSIANSQVLGRDYAYEGGLLVAKEMCDADTGAGRPVAPGVVAGHRHRLSCDGPGEGGPLARCQHVRGAGGRAWATGEPGRVHGVRWHFLRGSHQLPRGHHGRARTTVFPRRPWHATHPSPERDPGWRYGGGCPRSAGQPLLGCRRAGARAPPSGRHWGGATQVW